MLADLTAYEDQRLGGYRSAHLPTHVVHLCYGTYVHMLACTVQQSDAWTEYLQLHLSFTLTSVHLCMQVLVMFSFEFQDYNVPFQPAVVVDAVPCEHTYIHMYVCMHILYTDVTI